MPLKGFFLNTCWGLCLYLTIILALAIFGYFSFWPVLIATIIFASVIIILLLIVLKNFRRPQFSTVKIAIFFLIIIYVLSVGIYHHDLPTARDDLSYIYAADRLVESHSLKWDDYFSRPVHGVRQLDNNTFTSQFLPAYVGYLGVFYLFGGINLLPWANALLLFLALGAIYYLTEKLAGEKAALLAIIFFLSSYVFYWFPRRTNVENIFIFLIWFGLWLLIESADKKKLVYLVSGLVPFSLLALARAEGLIFFASFLIAAIIVFFKFKKLWLNSLYLTIISLSAVIANFLLFYFYAKFYKAEYIINQLIDVFDSFGFISHPKWILGLLSIVIIFAGSVFCLRKKNINFQPVIFWFIIFAVLVFELGIIILAATNQLTWDFYRSQYVLESFVFYFYFIPFFIILFGLKHKVFSAKEFWLTMVILPAFFFFVEPNIAPDHPWFMRRFYPHLIPFFTILSAVALARLNITKRQLKLVTALIVISGLVLVYPIIFFAEHRGIQNQVEEFNAKFPQQDALIIMDPGWNWQKIALLQHYFYGLNSLPNLDLYRFEESKKELSRILALYPAWRQNDVDLVAILNWFKDQSEKNFLELLKKYPVVYTVTENENTNLFNGYRDQNLKKINSYTFSYQELEVESNITGYIRKSDKLDLKVIRDLQNILPPGRIIAQNLKLDIYQVIDPAAYIPFEYVIDPSAIVDSDHVYTLLNKTDLKNFRKDINNTLQAMAWEASE